MLFGGLHGFYVDVTWILSEFIWVLPGFMWLTMGFSIIFALICLFSARLRIRRHGEIRCLEAKLRASTHLIPRVPEDLDRSYGSCYCHYSLIMC